MISGGMYLEDGAYYPLKPIERFEIGKWYIHKNGLGRPYKCLENKGLIVLDDGGSPLNRHDWREVVGYKGPSPRTHLDMEKPKEKPIDVSGDYPSEMMPKLVETAKKIENSGSCENIDCETCPSSIKYHHGNGCAKRTGIRIDSPEMNLWFRAFVEMYERMTDQIRGFYHSIPSGTTGSPMNDGAFGMPSIGIALSSAKAKSLEKMVEKFAWNDLINFSIPSHGVVGAAIDAFKKLSDHALIKKPESIASRRKRMLHGEKQEVR